MVSLIKLVLVSLVLAIDDLEKVSKAPEHAPWYNCDGLKTIDDCIITRWCVWNKLGGSGAGACQYDSCLQTVDDETDVDTACPNLAANALDCKLYYITDTHNCASSTTPCPETAQSDRYCRASLSAVVKKPIDICFYGDLQHRTTDATTYCSGDSSCSSNGTDNFYCAGTDKEGCDVYNVGGDQENTSSFCGCLGKKYCNLEPGCAISKATGTAGECVPDPCFTQTAASTCVEPLPVANCGVKAVQRIVSGNLVVQSICVSNSSSSLVQKNDLNQCFYATLETITYPTCTNGDAALKRECANVATTDKCADAVIYNDDNQPTDKHCTPIPIASGYFSPKVGTYCTDGKAGRTVPNPDAAFTIRVHLLPTLLLFALFAALAF